MTTQEIEIQQPNTVIDVPIQRRFLYDPKVSMCCKGCKAHYRDHTGPNKDCPA